MKPDILDQFRATLRARGIVPEEILADGKLHRCDVEGRNGSRDGAYVLHLDGLPAGGFQNWTDGRGWEDWRADIGRTLSPAEEAAHRAKVEAMCREREAEDKKRKAEARERVNDIRRASKPAADDHPYLVRKGIKAHGLWLHNGLLVVPMRDSEGVIHSLQFISANGEKRFLTGGRVTGCYCLIGKPDGVLCVAEGFATGASIHEATGHAVAVAFNVGNLDAVARALRAKFPDARLILCADDDYQTEGNPGLAGARKAARAVGGLLAIPSFDGNRPEGATDFNDLYVAAGAEMVRACIEGAGFAMQDEKVQSTVEECQCHLEAPPEFNLTDMGNAERLVWHHGQDLRYCHDWRKWLCWDGRRWAVDATAEVRRRAKDTVRRMYEAAAKIQDDDRRKALTSWALKSESDMKIRAMLSLAESEAGMPVLAEDLDRDPWLLNCLNGTIDLKTGELRPHRREDLITKLCPVEYQPAADCPKWTAHLHRIMNDKDGLVTFLQRAFGYSFTGVTSERKLFIEYGDGANGKSTTNETVAEVLGDYAMRTPTETLLIKREGGIPNDVARLRCARFVYASEAEEGRKLAESLVKDLTGGDTVTARFMRAEWFEFQPQFKLWLSTNHKPTVKGTDRAIWDRIRLIPFTVSIPESERIPRHEMMEMFTAEFPGILAWLVQGCLEWRRHGLGEPDEVKQATRDYRQEQDVIGGFIEECCAVNPDARVKFKELYAAYCEWCGREKPISRKSFTGRLAERGILVKAGKGNVKECYGIGLSVTDGLPVFPYEQNIFPLRERMGKSITIDNPATIDNPVSEETPEKVNRERCEGCSYFHLPATWKPEQAMCQRASKFLKDLEKCPLRT